MILPDFLTRDPDGFIRVTGHRIGLLHLVYYYTQGHSPEALARLFPTLSLEQINRVIAFYLANREEADAYVAACLTEMDQQRAAARPGPGLDELQRRLRAKFPGGAL